MLFHGWTIWNSPPDRWIHTGCQRLATGKEAATDHQVSPHIWPGLSQLWTRRETLVPGALMKMMVLQVVLMMIAVPFTHSPFLLRAVILPRLWRGLQLLETNQGHREARSLHQIKPHPFTPVVRVPNWFSSIWDDLTGAWLDGHGEYWTSS